MRSKSLFSRRSASGLDAGSSVAAPGVGRLTVCGIKCMVNFDMSILVSFVGVRSTGGELAVILCV